MPLVRLQVMTHCEAGVIKCVIMVGENPINSPSMNCWVLFFFFLVSVNYNDLNMIHILGWEFIIPPNFGDSFSKCKILFTFFVILHFGFLIHWYTWHSSDFLSLLKVRNHPINQLFNTHGISATVSEALIYTVKIM